MKLLLLAIIAVVLALLVMRVRAAPQPAAEDASQAPGALAQAEEAMRARIRALGNDPVGELRAKLDDDVNSFSGSMEVGGTPRRKVDLGSLQSDPKRGERDFFDLLRDIRRASRQQAGGPAYLVYVVARAGGETSFEYFLEGVPLESIRDLRLDEFEFVPAAVYRQRFDARMLAELSEFEANAAISSHVPARLAAGRPVSPALVELHATIDWEGDVNNGGMDQYFARKHAEDDTGRPRSEMYPLVWAGLKRIGADEAAALFAESIALWAHFQPEVEAARVGMGIPAVPRQDESDIGGRYYQFQPDLDRLRAAYLRAHPEVLERL